MTKHHIVGHPDSISRTKLQILDVIHLTAENQQIQFVKKEQQQNKIPKTTTAKNHKTPNTNKTKNLIRVAYQKDNLLYSDILMASTLTVSTYKQD